MSWQKAIEEVRRIIAVKDGNNQMKIAKLILEVCEVKHGGKKSPKTVIGFAAEVGVSPTLLYRWIDIKRAIFDKLTDDQRDRVSYNQCAIVWKQTGSQAEPATIQKLMKTYISNDKPQYKLMRYCGDLRALAYNFEIKGAMDVCSDKLLEEILFYTILIQKQITKSNRKLTPHDHSMTSRTRVEALQMEEAPTIRGKLRTKDGGAIVLRAKEEKIYNFMKKTKKFWSPTNLGAKLSGLNRDSSSAWACRGLEKLQKVGLVERNKQGHYRVQEQTTH